MDNVTNEHMAVFKSFPRIPRLFRDVIITEKLDGTNAQIHITPGGIVLAGSRNRWLKPDADNYGFAAWCQLHQEELLKLGPGTHYGEWWGHGIQRGYGLNEKRFSLFNVARDRPDGLPACVSLVPVLAEANFSEYAVRQCIERLKTHGSVAAPGFMRPEGVVMFHVPSQLTFKITCEGDERPKALANE